MKTTLTNTDVLRAIDELVNETGLVPTVRQLGSHLGIAGPSVQRRIEALVASGLLTRKANQPRTLALTSEGRAVLSA